MRTVPVWFGLALCLCASLAVSAQDDPEDDEMILDLIREDGTQPESGPEPSAEFLRCNKAAWRMPGQYLVILREGSHETHVQRTIRRLRAKAARRGYLLDILQTFSGTLHGFLVKMSSDVLHLAVKLPHVHYIEEDSSIFAQSAPWNLQKILQPYSDDGGLAQVFLMDGSVHSSHREVEGRVLVTDFNHVPEEDGARVHRQASQCDSHGTHMAGVLSGADSGVARGAGVNLVRVLNCQGKGTVSGAMAGLEYIRASLIARPLDAVVVLLPFVGGFSRSLNTACREMVSSGVVVIAAAGNYREDACLYSPASEPEVITVGAVNSVDQLMSQGAGGTNFGRCVDLFAPGDDIVSASSDCSTCFTPRSGTSQAAAHAAGIAAVILSANQKASPVQLLHTMLHYSIRNTINLLSVPDPQRPSTPNLVSAMPPVSADTSKNMFVPYQVAAFNFVVWALETHFLSCMLNPCVVQESSGQMECVAYAGPAGKGLYAVARCCVIADLQCHVHSSPKPGQDVECERPQSHLTGKDLRCSRNTLNLQAYTQNAFKGGEVCFYGNCFFLCFTCYHQVEVACPAGWTLTDCNAISPGSILGPVAMGNSCHVHSSSGADGAVGIAVCCHIRDDAQPVQILQK
uniref:Proprotein convertase subtilisin/kexin type 9 n=1 Tax=Neogobius melanostomus TaxID=47308 RepID=A0A8C6TFZ5_9GOBI